ncbi:MAG: polysaccharide export protein, partial [Crocinitomicaceae bacterium]|nr:polysaccharide export protein [Crocinitomicaceae bacterium]
QQYVLDLTTTEVFNSPCYYLQQNDVVYVEPNATSRYRSTLIPSIAPVVISVTSLLISTITLILR